MFSDEEMYNSDSEIIVLGNTDTKGEFKSKSITRHPEYYFEDGSLVLLVEKTMFRIFRSSLTRHSTVFQDIFSVPVVEENREGSSDKFPFVLMGISAVDFERLLSIIYPRKFGVFRLKSAEEWTSVLHLATRWDFEDIRAIAAKNLESLPLSPLQKIVISRKYGIANKWTLAAYTALCQRPQPITVDEACQLGVETVTRIAQIRERIRRYNGYRGVDYSSHSDGRHSTCGHSPPKTSHQMGAKRSSSPLAVRASKEAIQRPMSRRDAEINSETESLAASVFGI